MTLTEIWHWFLRLIHLEPPLPIENPNPEDVDFLLQSDQGANDESQPLPPQE